MTYLSALHSLSETDRSNNVSSPVSGLASASSPSHIYYFSQAAKSVFTQVTGCELEHPLLAKHAGEGGCPKRNYESLAPWKLKKAKALMISYMGLGCSIEQIANECAISRSHFSRAFKNATGLAPHDWLCREKIRRAEELLRMNNLSICRVAQECGFSDQSYFTRVFRRLNGLSPRRWQLQTCSQSAVVEMGPYAR